MTSDASPSVIVVGAGVGGLALGVALGQRGIEVTLLERSGPAETGGLGIQISPNASRVLAALGCGPRLEAVACEPRAVEVRAHKTGLRLAEYPLGAAARAKFGAPYWHLKRSELIAMLRDRIESLPVVQIVDATEVASVESDTRTARVASADDRTWTADLVVGADGIHSRVRSYVQPDVAPVATGHGAWRCLVSGERARELRVRDVATLWCGPGAHLVHYFVAGGSELNVIGVVDRGSANEQSWRARGSTAELCHDFRGFNRSVRRLLETVEEPWRWALAEFETLPSWSRHRVTLLGDAGHPMLPFAAQGAAQALEDAWVLAACLSDAADVADALERYEQARKPRTRDVGEESRRRAALYHRRNLGAGIGALLGTAAAESAAGSTAALDWLYAYDAVGAYP